MVTQKEYWPDKKLMTKTVKYANFYITEHYTRYGNLWHKLKSSYDGKTKEEIYYFTSGVEGKVKKQTRKTNRNSEIVSNYDIQGRLIETVKTQTKTNGVKVATTIKALYSTQGNVREVTRTTVTTTSFKQKLKQGVWE
jgi:hypothetical protein